MLTEHALEGVGLSDAEKSIGSIFWRGARARAYQQPPRRIYMPGAAPAHALGAASSSAAALPGPTAAPQSPPTPAVAPVLPTTPGNAAEWMLGRGRPHDHQ